MNAIESVHGSHETACSSVGLEYILPYKARKQCENVEDVSVNRFDFRPLIYKYMILPMSEAISVTVAILLHLAVMS